MQLIHNRYLSNKKHKLVMGENSEITNIPLLIIVLIYGLFINFKSAMAGHTAPVSTVDTNLIL